MSGASEALAGIRVVDLTHLIAGPFCTMLLADAGADVIKVEPPTGDIARRRIPMQRVDGAPGLSGYFIAVNRGKRSITLDLKNARGKALLDELLAAADVLVENYRPGVLERLGLGLDALCQRHPRLVVASISAFGKERVPDDVQHVPGLAIVAEAMSGITSRARDTTGRPVWCGFPLGDYTAGLTAQAAILTALLQRERTGRGRRLDISMADSMLAFNASSVAADTFPGSDIPTGSLLTAPYGVYRCRDGFVAIGVNSDVFWQRLCTAMRRPDLEAEPTFATQAGRAESSAALDDLVEAWTKQQRRQEVVAALREQGVPVAPVNETADIAASELYAARGMLSSAPCGDDGAALVPASAQGHDVTGKRAPQLGEHTSEVLTQVLGLPHERIRTLSEQGAFGDSR